MSSPSFSRNVIGVNDRIDCFRNPQLRVAIPRDNPPAASDPVNLGAILATLHRLNQVNEHLGMSRRWSCVTSLGYTYWVPQHLLPTSYLLLDGDGLWIQRVFPFARARTFMRRFCDRKELALPIEESAKVMTDSVIDDDVQFRLWESLDAGAIPVVKHPVYNSLPKGNPIIQASQNSYASHYPS